MLKGSSYLESFQVATALFLFVNISVTRLCSNRILINCVERRNEY